MCLRLRRETRLWRRNGKAGDFDFVKSANGINRCGCIIVVCVSGVCCVWIIIVFG